MELKEVISENVNIMSNAEKKERMTNAVRVLTDEQCDVVISYVKLLIEKKNKTDILCNDLMKIIINQNQEPTVSGRILHEFLDVKSNYSTWFKRMCKYGFIENVDYYTCFPNLESENKHGGLNKEAHILKLDMAKEISMLQRNEKGKQARQYFIEVEKQFNSPDVIMARALKLADTKINNLQLENKELKHEIKSIIGRLENLL